MNAAERQHKIMNEKLFIILAASKKSLLIDILIKMGRERLC